METFVGKQLTELWTKESIKENSDHLTITLPEHGVSLFQIKTI